MVFSGIFPVDSEQFTSLRDALEKLCMNDAAITFEAETSAALGSGGRKLDRSRVIGGQI